MLQCHSGYPRFLKTTFSYLLDMKTSDNLKKRLLAHLSSISSEFKHGSNKSTAYAHVHGHTSCHSNIVQRYLYVLIGTRFVIWLRDCSRVESHSCKHNWPLVTSLIQLFYAWVTFTTWLCCKLSSTNLQSSVCRMQVWARKCVRLRVYVNQPQMPSLWDPRALCA